MSLDVTGSGMVKLTLNGGGAVMKKAGRVDHPQSTA